MLIAETNRNDGLLVHIKFIPKITNIKLRYCPPANWTHMSNLALLPQEAMIYILKIMVHSGEKQLGSLRSVYI